MISFSCPCGRTISAPDSRAGARGHCPACRKPVRVPALALASTPADSVLDSEELFRKLCDDSSLDFADPHPTPRSGSAPPCAGCGTVYEPGTIVCTRCGISLLTGQPLAAASTDQPFHSRHPRTHEPDVDPEIGFWNLTFRTVFHPLSTMESFTSLFARQDLLAKAAVFYAVSFAALAIATFALGDPRRRAEELRDSQEIERVMHMDAVLPAGWVTEQGARPFAWKVEEPLGEIEAGMPFRVRIRLSEPGLDAPISDGLRVAHTVSHGNGPAGEWTRLEESEEAGVYAGELTATREGASSWIFEVSMPPGTAPGRHGAQRGVAHATWAHKPGWGLLVLHDRRENMEDFCRAHGFSISERKKPLTAAAGTVGTVVASLLVLLLGSAIYTLVARVLGGGGGFLLMLVTLGYITGLANFLQLGVLLLPLSMQPIAQYGILGWALFMELVALSKVYDLDLLLALVAWVMAGAVKVFGAVYLAVAVVKFLA